MIIKKFTAATEKDAIIMAKEELGSDAIVMNVKTIKPAGIMRIFKKTRVELTAAIDDAPTDGRKAENTQGKASDAKNSYVFNKAFESNSKEEYSEEAQNAIEEKINSIAKLLEQQMNLNNREKNVEVKVDDPAFEGIENRRSSDSPNKPANKIVELIRNQLMDNDVSRDIADAIVADMDDNEDGSQPLDNILSNVYQKIVLKLGKIEPLKPAEDSEKKPKIVFFVGNTGVGKTTTMAKLASKCKLEEKLDIAMLSVDTYRIAAIEQIKTYANILNAPMEVVYTPEDMKTYVEKFKSCDLIFVDTAGRSHRNDEQKKDLEAIIASVDEYEKEIYLVLSVTVKYNDLINIAKTYGELFDYKVIFTKLDETSELGSILNLKLDTGKQLSYVTWGQNVPEDIGLLNPQVIAKKLLGGAK